jgi:hypothetical protein
MLEELVAEARMQELRRESARVERESHVLRAMRERRSQALPSRAERLLNELYGAGRTPGADPALFHRLVWNGLDL